jgi:hypothetical protein
MEQTWSSANDLTLASVQKSWVVVLTLGIFISIILVAAFFAHRADTRAKAIKPMEDVIVKAAWSLNSRKRQPKLEQSPTPRMQRVVMESDIIRIEKALPEVLRTKSFMERFKGELQHYHRWFGIIFYYSNHFPRVLRVISLATSIVTMLFVQAVTYKLTNPDDGSCELFKTEAECLLEPSPFSTGESKCHWTKGFRRGTCNFSEPENSLLVVVLVAVLASIVSTPLSMFVEWLVMHILAAPTQPYRSPSIENFERQVNRAAGGRVPVGPLTSTSVQADLSALLHSLRKYRRDLTALQRKEFDGKLILHSDSDIIILITYNLFSFSTKNYGV